MSMQYTVPQFIDIEDKVLGPVTVRQFIVVIVGTGLLVGAYSVFYKALGLTFIFFILAFLIIAGIIAFAFIKINGRPFHFFLLNILQSLRHPGLRVWDNRYVEPQAKALPIVSTQSIPKKAPLSQDRLARLAMLVDTGGVFQDDNPPPPPPVAPAPPHAQP